MTKYEFEFKFKVKKCNPDVMTATEYDYYCHAQDVWNHLDAQQKSYITAEMIDDVIAEYRYLLRKDYYWEDAVCEAIDNICYDPDEEDDDEYIPSSSNGDYSPSNPWDAPGMKLSDFI